MLLLTIYSLPIIEKLVTLLEKGGDMAKLLKSLLKQKKLRSKKSAMKITHVSQAFEPWAA